MIKVDLITGFLGSGKTTFIAPSSVGQDIIIVIGENISKEKINDFFGGDQQWVRTYL